MKLRLFVCLAFAVVAASQSVSGHSVQRRQAIEDTNYDYPYAADEASEYEAQNDGDKDDTEKQNKSSKPPAVILTLSSTHEAELGKDLLLPCKVSPDSGTVVQWYKDQTLSFMGRFKITEEERYSMPPNSTDLIIKSVQPSDAAVFKCEIAQEQPVSINHTVLFPEQPKVISMMATSNGHVSEDTDVTLTCTVTGTPNPQVVWSVTKDENNPNQRLTEKDGEFSVNGNVYSMIVKKIRVDQAGRYYCYAINKLGSHQGDIVVKVNAKPRVHVPKTVVNSDIQVEAVLQCSAHETPKPHIRWYKDGVLIEDSSSQYNVNTHGTHSNLTVTPATDEDFGTFTCEAENTYGKHNKSIELVQKPVIEDIKVDGAKLIWTVNSHQPLEDMQVQLRNSEGKGEWKNLMVPIPQGVGHKYEVTYVIEDSQLDSGKYDAYVKVKNTKSWGTSADPIRLELVEDVQPEFIQHASVFRANGGHSIRSTVASTVLMYLLVRTL